MALKLGAASISFLWNAPLSESWRSIADLGYRYIEALSAPPHFWPRGMGEKERTTIRELAAGYGLEIVALNPTGQDINMASTNPGIHAETVAQLKEQIKLAHDLGAKIVVIPAGRLHSLVPAPLERVRQLVKDAIQACLDDAAKYEIYFGLENVPFSFMNKADDLVQIVHELNDHPYLKIVYDVANGFMVEDVIHGLSTVNPYLGLVHVSDTIKIQWGHTPIGTGGVDFKPVAQKLNELDYQGITILEVVDTSDPVGGLKSSAQLLETIGWQR